MADYIYTSTTDKGKLSGFTVTITTSRNNAALYENDKITINFSYTWTSSNSYSVTSSLGYIPKTFRFCIAPAECSNSTAFNFALLDFGNFELGEYVKGQSRTIGPIQRTFSLPRTIFQNFLTSLNNPKDTNLKTLKEAGQYVDQIPVSLKLFYEFDKGEYSSAFSYGSTTKYAPQYFGNLGFNIKGTIERCNGDGESFEQGEYIRWTSFYFESLNTTSDNTTLPSSYLNTSTSSITLKYGVETPDGGIRWSNVTNTSKLASLIRQNPTSSYPYSESKIAPSTASSSQLILSEALPDTLSSNVTIQITYTSVLGGGTFTGTFTLNRAQAKLHISGAAKGGVAIGRFSSSDDEHPFFEVDKSHRSIFYSEASIDTNGGLTGGTEITGINDYQLGEHLTGGYWITNNQKEPIYRYIFDEDIILVSGINIIKTFNFVMEHVLNMTGSIQQLGTTGTKFSPLTAIVSTSNPQNQAICTRISDGHQLEIEVGSNVVTSNNGSFHATIILEYTKASGAPRVIRPAAPMTSNSSQNCVASASSTYSSSYPAWRAFSGNLNNSWASRASDTSGTWIQLQMDTRLKNINVAIYARKSSTIRNPVAGKIQGSINGSSFTDIGSFSNWNPSLSNSLLGEVICENEIAYDYVRILITSRTSSSDYVAIGDIKITGEL